MIELLEFFKKMDELKNTQRKGWVLAGIPNPESVASHSYMCALLVYMFGPEAGVNVSKAIKMALVHDMGESITGDITPHDNISPEKKTSFENDALIKLCAYANNKEMLELWKEYAERKTPEAIFVHHLDKLEMAIQAYNYEMMYPEKNLDEFWTSAEKKITMPCLKKIYDMLYASRKKR